MRRLRVRRCAIHVRSIEVSAFDTFVPAVGAGRTRPANAITEEDLVSQLEAGSAFWRDVLSGPLIKRKGDIPHEVARRLREGPAAPCSGKGPPTRTPSVT